MQPRWNWILSACDSQGPGGATPEGAACALNPFSTLDLHYVATYQLRMAAGGSGASWVLDRPSSLNTDGAAPLVNLTELQQPSVGAGWGVGYYPRETLGVGPPGMLFVLSSRSAYNYAWYLLNQATLDRCPSCGSPNCRLPGSKAFGPSNCWGNPPSGSEAGEIDLLETPFWSCNGFPELCDRRGYGRSYLTSGNSKGFCNPKLNSKYSQYYQFGMGGHGSTNYFDDGGSGASAPGPMLYAAVVDAAGVTIYRQPDWPGLTATTASPVLTALRPRTAPERTAAPCPPSPASCARYSPVCVTVPSNATTYALVPRNSSRVEVCPGNGSFGMSPSCVASSWWNAFADTGQWAVDPSDKEQPSA